MVKSDLNQICHMVSFTDKARHERSEETPLQVALSDTTCMYRPMKVEIARLLKCYKMY